MSGVQRWDEISARAGRNDLPALMFNAHAERRLASRDLPAAVTQAWIGCEWPEGAADRELWMWVFEEAGFIIDGESYDDSEKPDTITLYRGATEDRALGMSWTTDLARARWFAQRFVGLRDSQPTFVYKLEATSTELLAHFTGRGEDEWVVDTTDIEVDDLEVVS